MDVSLRLQALLLSRVVTRLIKAPAVQLTTRPVADPEEVLVPTRHGEVRCYITRACEGAPLAKDTHPPPVHVNMHGGAFLIGAPRQDDHLVRCIAGEVGATVVNVDYSTAPAARYPQAHEECYDVLRWVQRSGSTMGWDDHRVSVGGGSAGGNLALGVLELGRGAGDPGVRACVLIVPTVDQTIPPEAYVSPSEPSAGPSHRPFVSPRLIRMVQTYYFADTSLRRQPLASPTLGADLGTLPPLLVIAAEHDSLRPQIEVFVDRVRAAGVSVTYHCHPGVDHDFPVRPDEGGKVELAKAARTICDHLIRHLA